jgi:Xaa-Pro aminopeptidase
MCRMTNFDHAGRRARFEERLAALGVDAAFLPPSGDLEYLTGFPRRKASFGNYEHVNQWVLGALLVPGHQPTFVIPQGYSAFQLPGGVAGDVVHVRNVDDGYEMFSEAIRSRGNLRRVGVTNRTWAATALNLVKATAGAELVNVQHEIEQMRWIKEAVELEVMTTSARICDVVMAEITAEVHAGVTEAEIASKVDHLMVVHGGRTPSFDTGVFALGPSSTRDASIRIAGQPLSEGDALCFDFGTVVEGYCSDFGRTLHIGEPNDRYIEAYDVVIASQEAGRRVAVPGSTGREVHAATRKVIEDAGYGEWYRHRTGHCIGLDTHERPFISEEDTTALEPNMTFTIEPSIFWPGTLGVRVEDIFVCAPGGAYSLNDYSKKLVSV